MTSPDARLPWLAWGRDVTVSALLVAAIAAPELRAQQRGARGQAAASAVPCNASREELREGLRVSWHGSLGAMDVVTGGFVVYVDCESPDGTPLTRDGRKAFFIFGASRSSTFTGHARFTGTIAGFRKNEELVIPILEGVRIQPVSKPAPAK